MSLEEYLDDICQRRNVTRIEFAARMHNMGMRVGVCSCTDYHNCKGWSFKYEEQFDSHEEWIAATQEVV